MIVRNYLLERHLASPWLPQHTSDGKRYKQTLNTENNLDLKCIKKKKINTLSLARESGHKHGLTGDRGLNECQPVLPYEVTPLAIHLNKV